MDLPQRQAMKVYILFAEDRHEATGWVVSVHSSREKAETARTIVGHEDPVHGSWWHKQQDSYTLVIHEETVD